MKLHTLFHEYQSTEVLEGSRYSFFFLFWCTKLLSALQRKSDFLNGLIHKVYTVAPQSEFVIKNHGGIFAVHPFDDSTTICADYFEQDIRDWLLTPPTKDVFIDIGANRGIYSIIAPTHYGYQTVHALEPNEEMFNVLKHNVQLNKLEHTVTCHNFAAGKEAGTGHFSVDPMHKGGGRIVTDTDAQTFAVAVQSLDSLISDVPAEKISFIKIDTEGFEFDVLSGMSQILNDVADNTCLMIETTELQKMIAVLSPYGFTHLKSKNQDHLFEKQT